MPADMTCFYCQNKAAPFVEGELPRGWVRLQNPTPIVVESYMTTTLSVSCHEATFCNKDHATKWLDVALDNLYHRTLEEMEAR